MVDKSLQYIDDPGNWRIFRAVVLLTIVACLLMTWAVLVAWDAIGSLRQVRR